MRIFLIALSLATIMISCQRPAIAADPLTEQLLGGTVGLDIACLDRATAHKVAQALMAGEQGAISYWLNSPKCFRFKPTGTPCAIIHVDPKPTYVLQGRVARIVQCRLPNGDTENWLLSSPPGADRRPPAAAPGPRERAA